MLLAVLDSKYSLTKVLVNLFILLFFRSIEFFFIFLSTKFIGIKIDHAFPKKYTFCSKPFLDDATRL